nr:P-loop NTPase fold protein [uncultured Rahnella sp.]
MKLTLPEVDYSKGFSSENDIFNRKKLSIQLENIIRNSDDENLVIAINDAWGNGKTTFLKMWKREIELKNEFQVVYFDAFQNDFQNDPFVAISASIYGMIDKPELKEKYLKATKEIGKVLLKTTAKVGISLLTLGAAKGTLLEDVSDEIKEAIESPIESFIEEKLKGVEKEDHALKHFQDTLYEIAKDKKLIFIIDELDRSRPNYSLELLERVKHVFNTKNIYFILAVNKEQYKSIIKKTYGEIDSETYLSKFIHFWFSLPQLNGKNFTKNTLEKYLDYIDRSLEGKAIDNKTSINTLAYLLRLNDCSLRDAERCYSLLLILNATVKNGFIWEYQVGLSIMIYLKVKKDIIFKKIQQEKANLDEIRRELNIEKSNDQGSYHIIMALNSEFLNNEDYLKALEHKSIPVFSEKFGQRLKVLTSSLDIFENIVLE